MYIKRWAWGKGNEGDEGKGRQKEEWRKSDIKGIKEREEKQERKKRRKEREREREGENGTNVARGEPQVGRVVLLEVGLIPMMNHNACIDITFQMRKLIQETGDDPFSINSGKTKGKIRKKLYVLSWAL